MLLAALYISREVMAWNIRDQVPIVIHASVCGRMARETANNQIRTMDFA